MSNTSPYSVWNKNGFRPKGPAKGVPAKQRYGNSATAPGVQAPPPDVGGPPLDFNTEQYILGANRNLALGNANAQYQQGQLQQEYGYGPSGAANPYSRAALLQESFNRAKAGTLNSAGNQLYAGSYGRAQNENQRNYSIAADQNRRAYDQSVYGVNYGQAQNAANYGVGIDDQKFQAILRALGGA